MADAQAPGQNPMNRRHGWRLCHNYGNYGIYGWGLWPHYEQIATADGYVESVLVVQLGPWKAMFEKVETG